MKEGIFADKVLVTVRVVDLAATARRLGMATATDHRGRPWPEHDYRFVMDTPTGGDVTFNRYATAEQVAAYCEREGWLPS